MPQSSMSRLLLLGATGYIGGVVLDNLVKSTDSLLAECHITVLVRGKDRLKKLKEIYGDRIATTSFSGLEDTEFLTAIASEHDIVINAGTGFHAPSAEALVRGLGQRRGGNGTEPWIVHMSGASNVAYGPLDDEIYPQKRHSFSDDESEAILAQESALEALAPYPQRTAELAVWSASEAAGVRAIVLQAPFVFGEGLPHFGAAPRGIAIMMQFVLDHGYAFQLGDGAGRLAVGHVDDIADLFLLLLHELVGDGGQIFLDRNIKVIYPAVAMADTAIAARKCLDAALRKGILPKSGDSPKPEVKVVDLDEVAPYFGLGIHGKTVAALCWGRSVDTIGTVGMDVLGWNPKHLIDEWSSDDHFDNELDAMLGGRRHTLVYRSAMTIPGT